MCDQKLVAIHHVSFLVEQLSYLTNKLAIVKPKLVLGYILSIILYTHGYFALSVDIFKYISQKLKSLNVYKM